MFRRLGIPLALVCAMFVLGTASADVGRSGGIVILPNALPLIGCPHDIRASYVFDWGADFGFQLPSNLGPQVLVVIGTVNGVPITAGRIENGVLFLRACELISLRRAGIPAFRMMLADSQQRGLFLDIRLDKGEVVTVDVR